MSRATSSEGKFASSGRAWGVAALVWLAICCFLAVILFTELQLYGPAGLSTPRGSREIDQFVQRALLYPGPIVPALILIMPRGSAVMCALVLLAAVILLVLATLRSAYLNLYLAFWLGAVLPVVLAGLATWLAVRRRDWLVQRSPPSSGDF